MVHATIDSLSAGKYVSLTTFKKDGTPVPTPVWVTREGDRLFVITEAQSGKAKRLRNSSKVTVASCDVRGNAQGPAVEGTAILLDKAGTARVEALVGRKYGLLARAFSAMGAAQGLFRRLRGQQQDDGGRVGIEISLAN